MGFIYGILNEETNELRYIGKTKDVEKRFKEHLSLAKSTKRKKSAIHKWIMYLFNKNINVNYVVIDEVENNQELNDLEIFYIDYYKFLGCRLLNLTGGGEGGLGCKYTEEQKLQNSKRQGGKYFVDNFGNIYYSPAVAAKKLGLYESCIRKILKNNNRSTIKGYSFSYIDENTNITNVINKLKLKSDIYNNRYNRKVLSDEGRVFNSVQEASEYYNIENKAIIKCCLKTIYKTKNKTFCYLVDNDNVEENVKILKYRLNYRDSNEFKHRQSLERGTKPFKDGEGNIYYSIAEAARLLNLQRVGIRKVLQGKQNNYKKHTFYYAI